MDARSTTEVDKVAGAVLRARRTKAKLSQVALADSCGITFQQIQKYEKGSNRISVPRLFQLSDALGISAVTFLKDIEKRKSAHGEVAR